MSHEQLKQNAREIAALEKRVAEFERMLHEKHHKRGQLGKAAAMKGREGRRASAVHVPVSLGAIPGKEPSLSP